MPKRPLCAQTATRPAPCTTSLFFCGPSSASMVSRSHGLTLPIGKDDWPKYTQKIVSCYHPDALQKLLSQQTEISAGCSTSLSVRAARVFITLSGFFGLLQQSVPLPQPPRTFAIRKCQPNACSERNLASHHPNISTLSDERPSMNPTAAGSERSYCNKVFCCLTHTANSTNHPSVSRRCSTIWMAYRLQEPQP